MTDNFDLIIVGGGIGGSALATVMARGGRSVLLLEQSEVFEDRVRGEWIAPWGVTEVRRLGLYDLLMRAGGHHLSQHVTYDETLDPTRAEAGALPLGAFAKDVPGPLCLGHPLHCQVLIEAAARAGAVVRRGVQVKSIDLGTEPSVAYVFHGKDQTAHARLVVGAEGRGSMVRDAAGIVLHSDKPHHMFGGMLVDNVFGWDERIQAIGTEGDFAFLIFPQGDGRVRVYGSYPIDDRRRFSGPDGPQRFLDAFRMHCSPQTESIADGRPAGPLLSFFNNDSWTNEPFAEGAVLIGDEAGWNDPINGLGMSNTYRDVRIVSDLLLGSEQWEPALFAPYAEERRERMRRLRFVATIQASLEAEFDAPARDRRRRFFERAASDPSLHAHVLAILGGPEAAPAETFMPAYRGRVLGEPVQV